MFVSAFTSCLDFSKATDGDLEALAQACDPATFGKNDEDVLDETYRKAGKLDEAHYSTTFDPYSTGLMGALSNRLINKRASTSEPALIRAERYKINVYGACHEYSPLGVDFTAVCIDRKRRILQST